MSEVNNKEATTELSHKNSQPKKAVNKAVVILTVLLIAAVGVGGFMTFKYQEAKNNPQSLVQADQDKLIDKIGVLIDLPQDEEPSIATVSDKEKLKDQSFFKSAENGDTLLIYTNERKAILYRESSNKVIEVAPIAIDDTSLEGAVEQTPPTQEISEPSN